jgi:hypothetical protein
MVYPEVKNFFLHKENHLRLKNFLDSHFNSKEKINKEDILDPDTFKGVSIDSRVGRAVCTIDSDDLDNTIIYPFIEYAKSINSNAELDFISYVVYDNSYGFPQLVPHYDRPSKVCFLLDYQIDSNVQWDIVVDGKKYSMGDNDMITMNVTSQIHWRDPKVFLDGEYLKVIFFSFTDSSSNVHDIKRSPSAIDESFAAYKSACELAYPEKYKNVYKKLITLW